ncbi:NUDIX domain-containing protein [Streptomyces bohaiensis]|uniref:NUDIX domain-containing protein n=1 Tax=Streptomyces bohaiensis TaxID=1431344 RepID=UPI003B7CEE74
MAAEPAGTTGHAPSSRPGDTSVATSRPTAGLPAQRPSGAVSRAPGDEPGDCCPADAGCGAATPREPLAAGPLGMRLLAFARVPEDAPPSDHELTYAIVAARHRGRLLLVRERNRGCWELPGGGIDPGETARQAAARELWEEADQRVAPAALRFEGFARTALPDHLTRYGALFSAEISDPVPFTPNEEISGITWWDGGDAPAGGPLQTVDVHLAELTAG